MRDVWPRKGKADYLTRGGSVGNPYHDKAENVVYAWETNYGKSLVARDRDGLVVMIAENLQLVAWAAQQPQAVSVVHPKA